MNRNSTILIGQHFLDDVLKRFQGLKALTEWAFNQVQNEEDFFLTLDEKTNSIAIIIRHLSGNMKSRWTDFLTSDGEKLTRNRPREFDRTLKRTKTELLEIWETGWKSVFHAISSLTPNDLLKDVYIRKRQHSVLEAIMRQFSHYSVHVGQIILLAKHIESESWEDIAIPSQ